jgi:predicted CoA-binding protein
MTASEVLRRIFDPRSIAVVGVSRSRKQGAVFLLGLLDPGFQGNIYVVNPAATEIMGVRSYPTISALPERPDLAVLVLPVDPAIEVVRQCAEAGVPAVALFTAGFNEAGTPEGNARASALLDAAGGRTRLIGPNGMGIYNPARGIAMFPGMPAEVGGVGLISQSGSLVQFLVRAVTERGLGFSKAVSMGNQLDLDAADYLDYFADDPDTRVIPWSSGRWDEWPAGRGPRPRTRVSWPESTGSGKRWPARRGRSSCGRRRSSSIRSSPRWHSKDVNRWGGAWRSSMDPGDRRSARAMRVRKSGSASLCSPSRRHVSSASSSPRRGRASATRSTSGW